jgi:hypothetical protein
MKILLKPETFVGDRKVIFCQLIFALGGREARTSTVNTPSNPR